MEELSPAKVKQQELTSRSPAIYKPIDASFNKRGIEHTTKQKQKISVDELVSRELLSNLSDFPEELSGFITRWLGLGINKNEVKYISVAQKAIGNWWENKYGFPFSEKKLVENVLRAKWLFGNRLIEPSVMKLREKIKSISTGINIDAGSKTFGHESTQSTEGISGRQVIFYDSQNHKTYIKLEDRRFYINSEDIDADLEWGIKYNVDSSVPDKIKKRLLKRSAIAEARFEIEEKINQKLSDRLLIGNIDISYNRLEKTFLNGKDPGISGFIAEKMTRSFLKRLESILDIKVERANTLEDLELKYDFIINFHYKDSPNNSVNRVGVQLTTSRSARGKMGQLEKYQINLRQNRGLIKKPAHEVILVSIPITSWGDSFSAWLKSGKPPGGPEQFLSEEDKIEILKKTVADRLELTEEDLVELVKRPRQ